MLLGVTFWQEKRLCLNGTYFENPIALRVPVPI